MIYIPRFMKIDLDIQMLIGGAHMHTHRQEGDFKSLLLYFIFKIRKVGCMLKSTMYAWRDGKTKYTALFSYSYRNSHSFIFCKGVNEHKNKK